MCNIFIHIQLLRIPSNLARHRADSNTNMAELVRSVRPSLDNITTKIHLVVADDWLDNPEDGKLSCSRFTFSTYVVTNLN